MTDLLIQRLEEMTGSKIKTPKDFNRMSTIVFNRTGEMISPTTLKRIWGYIDEPLNTRLSTLSILARSLGYPDFEAFCRSCENSGEVDPSSPVLGRRLNVLSQLEAGDTVKLSWNPERKCIISYLGEGRFEVVESEKTRLKPGDTFYCYLIIAGFPLYLSELRQEDREPSGYVCGRGEGGVQFEVGPF